MAPKLYYTPTSCGAASFIAAYLAGFTDLECEQVDIQSHKTHSGNDFYAVNPKGNVPTIAFREGIVLNENAATLQFIADQFPGSIAPEYGTDSRYLLQNVLSFISSEFHVSSIGPLFNPSLGKEMKDFYLNRIHQKLDYIENTLLKDKNFLVDNKLSVADLYLYICLSWNKFLNFGLENFPKTNAFYKRVSELPEVKKAHEEMAKHPSKIPAK